MADKVLNPSHTDFWQINEKKRVTDRNKELTKEKFSMGYKYVKLSNYNNSYSFFYKIGKD